MRGQATVSRPMPSIVPLPDRKGRLRVGVPTMFSGAPLLDAQKQVVAGLFLRLRPEKDFTEILNTAQFGDTGETYAFDKQGLMLSSSHFDQQLKDLSVEHGRTLEHYRAAHEVDALSTEHRATTEQLRGAMVHYRALFEELLSDGGGARHARV